MKPLTVSPITVIGLGVVGVVVVLYVAEAVVRWWQWRKADRTMPTITPKR